MTSSLPATWHTVPPMLRLPGSLAASRSPCAPATQLRQALDVLLNDVEAKLAEATPTQRQHILNAFLFNLATIYNHYRKAAYDGHVNEAEQRVDHYPCVRDVLDEALNAYDLLAACVLPTKLACRAGGETPGGEEIGRAFGIEYDLSEAGGIGFAYPPPKD